MAMTATIEGIAVAATKVAGDLAPIDERKTPVHTTVVFSNEHFDVNVSDAYSAYKGNY